MMHSRARVSRYSRAAGALESAKIVREGGHFPALFLQACTLESWIFINAGASARAELCGTY